MKNEIIHIVPHSHWDREWYMTFEKHRFRLVKLIDSIIEKMENEPDYKFYHLDGQLIVLEDYLSVKPYMKERLVKLIRDGRIQVGPWYVLQDEYLISDEANVRNLLIGLNICNEMNINALKIGYLPDSFGNIAQMPQILARSGIDSVVFGRGVCNIAEIVWKSEDGSSVVGAHFTPWYNNANELPDESDLAKQRSEKLLGLFRDASKTNHYLGMNGSDHQPIQKNLTAALKAMNENSPKNVEYIHSNLYDYMNSIKIHKEKYPVISTEMAGQNTDGQNLLISTASSRIYLKQKNHTVQNEIERRAEPISATAFILGAEYPSDYMLFLWKQLLKNHAHDSICGCSVDGVHSEMMTRFEKAQDIAESITAESVKYINSVYSFSKENGIPIAVFNSSVYDRSGYVTVTVDFPEDNSGDSAYIADKDGNIIYSDPEYFPHTFTYVLPENEFRKVEYCDRFVFKFSADNVPACGFKFYFASRGNKSIETVMEHTNNTAENDYVVLTVEDDGSVTIKDKKSGLIFDKLNVYEDVTDIGDEYLFKGYGEPVTTLGKKAKIRLKEAKHDHVTFATCHELLIPEGFDREKEKTTDNKAPFSILTEITLFNNSRGVKIHTEIENHSGNHRLRALFSNDIKTDKVYAHGQFDVLKRNIKTSPQWIWPTNEQRMQSFAALKDDSKTLMIATRALYEYEVLRDGSNTLCLNLLRCVDQLGDWGYFATPDAQCIGKNIADYEIFIGESNDFSDMQIEALQFASGDMPAYCFENSENTENQIYETGLFKIEGKDVWNTAFKKSYCSDNCVLRLYNTKGENNKVILNMSDRFSTVIEADLTENPVSALEVKGNSIELVFKPKEIKTLLIK